MLGILTRRYTNNLLEAVRQVALTAKPCLDSYFCQRMAGLDQPLRVTDTHTFEISIWGHTYFGAKNTQQIIRAESDMFCYLG